MNCCFLYFLVGYIFSPFFSGIVTNHCVHRKGLVDKIIHGFENTTPVILVYGPPATGKTSLAQLVMKRFCDDAKSAIRINCAGTKAENCYEGILNKTAGKLDFESEKCSLENTLIVFDDCHAWFSHEEFWYKWRNSDTWMSPTVRILLVATTLLAKTHPSPIFFVSLPIKITRSDLLLSSSEVKELIDVLDEDQLFKGTSICDVIIEESNGIVRLISLSIGFLKSDFHSLSTYSLKQYETSVLQRFFSPAFTENTARCCLGVLPSNFEFE